MKKKRFSEEQIIAVLKEAEAGAMYRYRSRRSPALELRKRIAELAAMKVHGKTVAGTAKVLIP